MSLDPTPGASIPQARSPHHARTGAPRRSSRDPVRQMPEPRPQRPPRERPAQRQAERAKSAYEMVERAQRVAQSFASDANADDAGIPGQPAGAQAFGGYPPGLAPAGGDPSRNTDQSEAAEEGTASRAADAATIAVSIGQSQDQAPSAPAPRAEGDLTESHGPTGHQDGAGGAAAESLAGEPRAATGDASSARAATPIAPDPASYVQRYGSLPVLFAGELVELDLYASGRQPGAGADSARSLFLSLRDTREGRVEVLARASANRLRVHLRGSGAAIPEVASEQVRAVSELAARLGWKFESVEQAPEQDAEASASGSTEPRSPPGRLDRLV